MRYDFLVETYETERIKVISACDLPPNFSPIVMRHSPGLGFRAYQL
jgi:hypothetical protein